MVRVNLRSAHVFWGVGSIQVSRVRCLVWKALAGVYSTIETSSTEGGTSSNSNSQHYGQHLLLTEFCILRRW